MSSPPYSAIATGRVLVSGPVSTRANRNSLYASSRLNNAVTQSPGRTTGRATRDEFADRVELRQRWGARAALIRRQRRRIKPVRLDQVRVVQHRLARRDHQRG